MLKMLINLVVFSFLGALIGWIMGKLLTFPFVAYQNYQLWRVKKRTDKAISDAFAPIIELDRKQW